MDIKDIQLVAFVKNRLDPKEMELLKEFLLMILEHEDFWASDFELQESLEWVADQLEIKRE